MIYLSGVVRPDVAHPRIGWMVTPESGYRLPGHGWWAADNGCFAHPEAFDLARFARYVERRLHEAPDRCLFVTAPDVPGDSERTLERFAEHYSSLQKLGAPIAIVAQPGMGLEDVPWTDIDALFLGGGTDWRLGQEAAALAQFARSNGQWVHMGMVNTARRFRAAQSLGCDSVDGTFLKYGPEVNIPRLQGWLEAAEQQPGMVL